MNNLPSQLLLPPAFHRGRSVARVGEVKRTIYRGAIIDTVSGGGKSDCVYLAERLAWPRLLQRVSAMRFLCLITKRHLTRPSPRKAYISKLP